MSGYFGENDACMALGRCAKFSVTEFYFCYFKDSK